MAKDSSKHAAIAIDLSSLPISLQAAVGEDVARSVLARSGDVGKPVIVGKLRSGIYGLIRPDLLGGVAKNQLESLLKNVTVGK